MVRRLRVRESIVRTQHVRYWIKWRAATAIQGQSMAQHGPAGLRNRREWRVLVPRHLLSNSELDRVTEIH